jgi:hypothetical protein
MNGGQPTRDGLDAIDEVVAQISDAEVDKHLALVLRQAGVRSSRAGHNEPAFQLDAPPGSHEPAHRTRPGWFAPLAAAAAVVLVVAGGAAAGTWLGRSGNGHSGNPAAAAISPPHHLRSPFVLQAMRVRQPTPAGGCQVGYTMLPGANPGMCYRKTGAPVTITSAAVSPVTAYQPKPPPGRAAGPAQYEFLVTLPATDAPALTAVTTTAYNAQGALAISVAGRSWALPIVARPFTGRQFQIPLSNRNQALQLQRILAASG